jgi:hypothetical protein
MKGRFVFIRHRVCRRFAIAVLLFPFYLQLGIAQVSSQHNWYQPLTNGDGLRYPLDIGPLTWRLLGSGIYPVKGSDGLIHVAYALQFTNSWNMSATIQSVEVVDPARGNQTSGKNHVLDIKNEDVTGQVKLFTLPGSAERASYSSEVPAGQSAVMFFDVTYEDAGQLPKAIAHRVTVTTQPTPVGTEHTVVGNSIPIGREAMVISPPFRGSGWVNGNGCCLEIGPHRFATNAMNGTLDPSEQFAIDWVQIDTNSHAYRTDGKKPEDWLCYGVEILAVAPGTVVEVVRDLPNVAPGKNPEGLTIAQIAGNRVIIDMGSGHYAMYAHLAPGSIPVHVGDYVRQGQKIGLLGNTGNSSAPHLHFQLMDRPSSLDATSLPFVFDHMQLEGRVQLDLEALDDDTMKKAELPIDRKDAKPLTQSMPLSRDVVGFE